MPSSPSSRSTSTVVVNGWFWNRLDAGSGQYLAELMGRMPQVAADLTLHLLVPQVQGQSAAPQPDDGSTLQMQVHSIPLPSLPGRLDQVWWEQWLVPFWTRKLGAALLWNPYWTAPLWRPCPVTVTIHDLIPIVLPEYTSHWKQRLYLALTRFATNRVDGVITVSQAARRDILRHFRLPADRVTVVHNGADQASVSQPADLAQTRSRLRLPKRFFLYLGGFERRKNVESTLRAFQRFRRLGGDPDIKLVLAGRLPDRDTPVLQHPAPLIEALDLNDSVMLLGYVDEETKSSLFRLALAFVFPGRYEGFGLMLVEAMHAGLPIITSRA